MFSTGSSRRIFRSGAISGDNIFAVGLVIIICGALGVSGYFACRPDGGRNQGAPAKHWFECSKCDEQFALDPSVMTEDERIELDFVLGSDQEAHALDCIQCGATKKAFEMITCPNPECKKRYVPISSSAPWKQFRNLDKYKDICPHCKLELTEARVKAREAAKK